MCNITSKEITMYGFPPLQTVNTFATAAFVVINYNYTIITCWIPFAMTWIIFSVINAALLLPFHWRKQKRNEFQNFQTFSQPWPFCCLVSRNYNFLQSLWHQAATRQDELSLADILGVEMKSALSCHNWSFHCDPARLQGLIDSCCRTADSLARGLFFI